MTRYAVFGLGTVGEHWNNKLAFEVAISNFILFSKKNLQLFMPTLKINAGPKLWRNMETLIFASNFFKATLLRDKVKACLTKTK